MRWPRFWASGSPPASPGGGSAEAAQGGAGVSSAADFAAFRRQVADLAGIPLPTFDGGGAWMALLRSASRLEITDLHLEPQPAHALLRARRDGDLREVGTVPRPVYDRMLMALKNRSGMVGYVHSRPQDGRLQVDDPPLGVRVATVPVLHGEKVTLRLLATVAQIRPMDALGMDRAGLEELLARTRARHGLTLCVGPAGSGKTTTLYATLLRLHQEAGGSMSVATIEDPVEYEVPAFNQTPVNVERGLTFAAGLRSIVRHDPNAILVGEIRDLDTARTALQAALSGHLVMSTMHGSDAVGGLYRLLEMGVEPEVLGSGLGCVVAQRLVRTACPDCVGLPPAARGGCGACDGLGFRGRTGIFEMLEVGPEVQDALRRRVTASELAQQLRAAGVASLKDDLARKVESGRVLADANL